MEGLGPEQLQDCPLAGLSGLSVTPFVSWQDQSLEDLEGRAFELGISLKWLLMSPSGEGAGQYIPLL